VLRVAVVPCTSAIRLLRALSRVHHPAHNFLLKRGCCRFAQVIGITSDPKIAFPYLLKTCASTFGLCACPLVPEWRSHHSLEGCINLVARRSIRPHQRPRPHQNLVEPAAPLASRLPRFPSLAAFGRRPLVRVASFAMGRHPKPVTSPDSCSAASSGNGLPSRHTMKCNAGCLVFDDGAGIVVVQDRQLLVEAGKPMRFRLPLDQRTARSESRKGRVISRCESL
jgi:hypothetical protein